jgi:hypothetical protein
LSFNRFAAAEIENNFHHSLGYNVFFCKCSKLVYLPYGLHQVFKMGLFGDIKIAVQTMIV